MNKIIFVLAIVILFPLYSFCQWTQMGTFSDSTCGQYFAIDVNSNVPYMAANIPAGLGLFHYDGTNWTHSPLNSYPYSGTNSSLTFYQDTAYYLCGEPYLNLLKYNGSNWDTVGPVDFYNIGSGLYSFSRKFLIFLDSIPYIAIPTSSNVTIMRLVGGVWETIGTYATGFNTVYYDFIVADTVAYLSCRQNTNLYVFRYTGTSWDTLATFTQTGMAYPDLEYDGNTLYLISQENNYGNFINIRKYNGQWFEKDTFNLNASYSAECLNLKIYNNKPYILSNDITGNISLFRCSYPEAIEIVQNSFQYTQAEQIPELGFMNDTPFIFESITGTIDLNCGFLAKKYLHTTPVISSQPTDTSVCVGNSFTFSTTVTGGPLYYRWFKNNVLISNQTNHSLTFNSIALSDTGYYKCFITNGIDDIYTDSAYLNVKTLPDGIISLTNNTACLGESTQFNIQPSGSTPLSFQWTHHSTNISGANSTTYSIPASALSDSGYYKCKISNYCGDTYTDSLHLAVYTLTSSVSDITLSCGDTTQINNLQTNYIGTGTLNYSWSPNEEINDTSISNPTIYATSNKVYTVNIFSSTSVSCATKDTLHINLESVNTTPELCMVGVSKNKKNILVWNKLPTNLIDSFYVYKESTTQTGLYNHIGSVAYQDSSTFTDMFSLPTIQSNKYKIAILDKCGYETPFSPAHKTMHLNINQGMGNSWNLIWEEYEGFTVSSYKIYRGIRTDSLSLIGSTAGGNTSYSDFSAPSGFVYYQVEVISPNACNPSKNYNSSRSNIATNNPYGVDELDASYGKLQIFPNPANEKTTITWNNTLHQKYQIKVTDISGKIIIKENITSDSFILNAAEYASGTYFIEVSGSEIFRGRIEIE